MSTESTTSSSLYLIAPTTSTSTNLVDEALLASSDGTESDSPPTVPWRTGADTQLPRRTITYIGHTHWRANHPPEPGFPPPRPRRVRFVRVRRKRRIIDEHGISRDFFLIIALCFVLACLLFVFLRPIALGIFWYIDDGSY